MFVPHTIGDLKFLVEQRLEETVQLEFKRQLPEPGKNKDLAIDICAMANTEGGVIVYGVSQDDKGYASELTPFPVLGCAERVIQVARTLIDEPIEPQVHTVSAGGSVGFLVVVVPRSERTPHFVNGTAWARTSKGNVTLTRRRIGELFAASSGFAEEFGLVLDRPGRVLAEAERETYAETDSHGYLKHRRNYFIKFRNDGDSDVYNVRWEWCSEDGDTHFPHVLENPFPIDVMPPKAELRIWLVPTGDTSGVLRIRTLWTDKQQIDHELVWPITLW